MNYDYVQLITDVWELGEKCETRGAEVIRRFGRGMMVRSPLITIRKTAWKTALKEMEWFMSGFFRCPNGVLRDVWWNGQLDPNGNLMDGYATQFRNSSFTNSSGELDSFDQVAFVKKELVKHPKSRRIVMTTWNPGEMYFITETNKNPMTPACCHGNYMQFTVMNGKLHMNTVFRSSDIILGLPHNLVQHRALQLYFAHHAGVPAANFYHLFLNDYHIYTEHSDFVDFLYTQGNVEKYVNIDACLQINEGSYLYDHLGHEGIDLVYTPTDEEFKASDFTLTEEPPEPIYTKKIDRTL